MNTVANFFRVSGDPAVQKRTRERVPENSSIAR